MAPLALQVRTHSNCGTVALRHWWVQVEFTKLLVGCWSPAGIFELWVNNTTGVGKLKDGGKKAARDGGSFSEPH